MTQKKCFYSEKLQVISMERVIKLENHHYTAPSETEDSGKDHQ